MVLIGQAVKSGLRLAGKIDKKYNLNKIFIQKYVPPGYRKTANRIVDIAGTLGGGYGLYNFVESLYAPSTPGNPNAFQTKSRQRNATYKSYKTRRRRATSCYPRSTKKQYPDKSYRYSYSRNN